MSKHVSFYSIKGEYCCFPKDYMILVAQATLDPNNMCYIVAAIGISSVIVSKETFEQLIELIQPIEVILPK